MSASTEPHIEPIACTTTSNFTCFPELPVELRLVIWSFAMPGPRAILAVSRTLKRSRPIPSRSISIRAVKLISNPIPTPLLHTSLESRELAQRALKAGFSANYAPGQPTYIDWERDTLFAENDSALDGLCRAPRPPVPRSAFEIHWQDRIRHMVIGGPASRVILQWGSGWKYHHLGHLKTLTLELYEEVNFSPVPGFGAKMVRKYLYDCWEDRSLIGEPLKMPDINFVEKGGLKKMYPQVCFTVRI
jgi:hypothetical protein